MAFSDHFVGAPQSRWAGYAILVAIIAVALSILFGKENISIGKRVLIILIMFLFALPTIAIVLFQLTCLVNGTSKAPFCGWYAWIVAVITIVYCILLIIVAITVKSSDKHAEEAEKFSVSFQEANVMAKKLMNGGFEMFEDMPENDEDEEKEEGEEGFENSEDRENEENKMEKFAADINTVAKDVKVAKPVNVFGYKESFSTANMKGEEDKKEEAETFTDYSFGAATIGGTKPNMYML